MQRGKQAIYEKLFEPATSEKNQTSKVKGRAQWLIVQRNECMLHRYVYYAKLHDLKYEQVLTKLSDEFFLSPRTITDILSDNQAKIKSIRDEAKDVKNLKSLFPFMNWVSKA